jgi:pimeloyl-ACP methyl ester carboxylesterase
MHKLEEVFDELGFHAVNIDYPSREKPIEQLALEAIDRGLDECEKRQARQVHFVTHSLGGILVRYYLSRFGIENLGRVVMLSPPNQGSEAADWLRDVGLYQWLNGPAGQQLGTDADSVPAKLGPVTYPVGVITGNESAFFDFWLSQIIPGEDDGKVSVQRARVAGMRDFLVLPYSHPFISGADEVIEQTLNFLRQGCFQHADPKQASSCNTGAIQRAPNL